MFSRVCIAVAAACFSGLSACGGGDVPAAPDVAAPLRYAVAPDARTAQSLSQQDPTQSPPGTNIWTCRPTPAHPHPLILVPGTFFTMESDFGALGPMLANTGYCVFTLNYGYQRDTGNYATGPMADSGLQLATLVAQVLAASGAQQVDLIGHSQGGTLAEYYAKSLGGAGNVAAIVGLAPTTHGTTLQGMATLAQAVPGLNLVVGGYCPACVDQEPGSRFIQQLDAGAIAQPGVRYTVIETRNEKAVTPVGSAFIDEPGVSNFYVQDRCAGDRVDHGDLGYDAVVFREILNALDPAGAAPPDCASAYPVPMQ